MTTSISSVTPIVSKYADLIRSIDHGLTPLTAIRGLIKHPQFKQAAQSSVKLRAIAITALNQEIIECNAQLKKIAFSDKLDSDHLWINPEKIITQKSRIKRRLKRTRKHLIQYDQMTNEKDYPAYKYKTVERVVKIIDIDCLFD